MGKTSGPGTKAAGEAAGDLQKSLCAE